MITNTVVNQHLYRKLDNVFRTFYYKNDLSRPLETDFQGPTTTVKSLQMNHTTA